jgi:hypothetical protein
MSPKRILWRSRGNWPASSRPHRWEFKFNTTRTGVEVEFEDAVAPGNQVWLCACWHNPRAQSGPAAAPVGTNRPGGGVMQMAA